mmetsp:Transcript_24021/g.38996  ORF Transcript_24021/g.38996 Transcript_24021/m.38996 type:complete len:253 (-) Transcript_24021:945-1703(-)
MYIAIGLPYTIWASIWASSNDLALSPPDCLLLPLLDERSKDGAREEFLIEDDADDLSPPRFPLRRRFFSAPSEDENEPERTPASPPMEADSFPPFLLLRVLGVLDGSIAKSSMDNTFDEDLVLFLRGRCLVPEDFTADVLLDRFLAEELLLLDMGGSAEDALLDRFLTEELLLLDVVFGATCDSFLMEELLLLDVVFGASFDGVSADEPSLIVSDDLVVASPLSSFSFCFSFLLRRFLRSLSVSSRSEPRSE